MDIKKFYSCSSREELVRLSEKISNEKGPIFLEIKVKKGSRKNLGRPTTTPIENKEMFMKFLEN